MSTSSPLRTNSKERTYASQAANRHHQPQVNVVQQHASSSSNTFGEQHLDFYITEQRQEIAELKSKNMDVNQLRDQIVYLQNKIHEVNNEKTQLEQNSQTQIYENMQVVEQQIRELDDLKYQNEQEEDLQIRLLDEAANANYEVQQANVHHHRVLSEVSQWQQKNEVDQRNLEIVQGQYKDAEQVNSQQFQKMNQERDKNNSATIENDSQNLRISSMQKELEENNLRCNHLNEVLNQKENELLQGNNQLKAAHQEISNLKFQLNQLDSEICYFEDQNRKNQQAQSQLQKALEYEYVRGKEMNVVEADLTVKLQTKDSELQHLNMELNQVKSQNSAMVEDSHSLQDELAALNRHMNVITKQNYELSAELQQFLQTDEIVKHKLNRKTAVEEIRAKVDNAIRRSEYEVQRKKSPHRSSISPMRGDTADAQQYDKITVSQVTDHKRQQVHQLNYEMSNMKLQNNDRGDSPLRMSTAKKQ